MINHCFHMCTFLTLRGKQIITCADHIIIWHTTVCIHALLSIIISQVDVKLVIVLVASLCSISSSNHWAKHCGRKLQSSDDEL